MNKLKNKKVLTILKEAQIYCKFIFGNKIKDIYLYGSYARGDYDKESDVDIFITVDLTLKQISKYRKQISYINNELSLKYDITISIIVESAKLFAEFAEDLPFYKNVISEGIHYGKR